MSEYLWLAPGLFFVAGILLGRHIWYEPADVHKHAWLKWEDCPIRVTPVFRGTQSGEPCDTTGQERRCETCGKSELRRHVG